MTPDLFDTQPVPGRNLLPRDGDVEYFGQIFTSAEADQIFAHLCQDIEWHHDQAVIYGKTITTRRKVAWYAEQPYSYTYSGTTKTALGWTELLLKIKQQVEAVSQTSFNSCLLNLYHSGEEGMAWHSDAEQELKPQGEIASLSFGAVRNFQFKHKGTKDRIGIRLEHGSLLVMKGTTQTHWLHCLPKAARLKTPRINLTFRQINTRIRSPAAKL